MKYVASLGVVFVLAVMLASAADLESWRRTDYVRTRTIQNLAPSPQSAFEGWFLSTDDTGAVKLSSDRGDSNSWWQVKMIAKKRNYTAHTIINRGNHKYNGWYLALDPVTGDLMLSRRETNTCYWMVRYAGKYNGWDSFYIQNTAETQGVTDMAFLTIDEKTGELRINNRPTRGMNWMMQVTPDLPAETKHY